MTTISKWGHSSGVRIPAKILERSRFSLGDEVDFDVNERGDIEITAPTPVHRKLRAPGRVTADELYERHPAGTTHDEVPAWPDDDMVGAEWESWAQ